MLFLNQSKFLYSSHSQRLNETSDIALISLKCIGREAFLGRDVAEKIVYMLLHSIGITQEKILTQQKLVLYI